MCIYFQPLQPLLLLSVQSLTNHIKWIFQYFGLSKEGRVLTKIFLPLPYLPLLNPFPSSEFHHFISFLFATTPPRLLFSPENSLAIVRIKCLFSHSLSLSPSLFTPTSVQSPSSNFAHHTPSENFTSQLLRQIRKLCIE